MSNNGSLMMTYKVYDAREYLRKVGAGSGTNLPYITDEYAKTLAKDVSDYFKKNNMNKGAWDIEYIDPDGENSI